MRVTPIPEHQQGMSSNPAARIDDSSPNYVTAFSRGLSVIRCFAEGHPRQTIADVAKATGLNRATSRRLLHTLERDGYVSSEKGFYMLRPAAMELGHAYLSSIGVGNSFQRRLQNLAEQVNETCSAGVLDRDDTSFVARAEPSSLRMMTLDLSVGARLPAYLTAIGRVLLADLSRDEIQTYLGSASFQPQTTHTIFTPDALEDELARIREQGFAALNQEIELEICAIAVPVRRPGRPSIGISVAAHTGQTDLATLLDESLPVLMSKSGGFARH